MTGLYHKTFLKLFAQFDFELIDCIGSSINIVIIIAFTTYAIFTFQWSSNSSQIKIVRMILSSMNDAEHNFIWELAKAWF